LKDPSSPLLQSPEAFKIYLTCLEKVGQTSSINAAVGKRDELLATQVATIAADQSSAAESSPAPLDTPAASPIVDTPSPEPSKAPSPSEVIAQQVLSKSTAQKTSSSGPPVPEVLKLAATGEGQAAPIQVSIVERRLSLLRIYDFGADLILGKGAWIPRLLRFLVLVTVSSFCESNAFST